MTKSTARLKAMKAAYEMLVKAVERAHMLRELAPDIPVLFLDTVHHFPQTVAYRDALAARWGLNLS